MYVLKMDLGFQNVRRGFILVLSMLCKSAHSRILISNAKITISF